MSRIKTWIGKLDPFGVKSEHQYAIWKHREGMAYLRRINELQRQLEQERTLFAPRIKATLANAFAGDLYAVDELVREHLTDDELITMRDALKDLYLELDNAVKEREL